MERDGSKNPYANVGNLRITYVLKENRDPAKNWTGGDTLRMQAYSSGGGPHMGPEFPIDSEDNFLELIQTLCAVYREGRKPKV